MRELRACAAREWALHAGALGDAESLDPATAYFAALLHYTRRVQASPADDPSVAE